MIHDPIPLPPHGIEKRRDGRHASVLLIGRVRHGLHESACLVRDISPRGLMARFTTAPAVGDRLCIEVRGLAEVAATVRWVDGFRGGVEFDRPHDIAAVFCLRDDHGHVARTPRFAMTAGATLRVGDRRLTVDLLDVSPGGAKVCGAVADAMGRSGCIRLPHLQAATDGAICWTREDRAGFRFNAPLSLADLSRVLGC